MLVCLVVQAHRFQVKSGFKLKHIIGQYHSLDIKQLQRNITNFDFTKLTKVFVHEKYVPGRTFETSNYSQYVNIKCTVANAKVTCSKRFAHRNFNTTKHIVFSL